MERKRRCHALHEASVAFSILKAAEEVLEEHGVPADARIEALDIEIGALALIDLESLRFALEVLSKGTRFEGAKFNIHIVTPRLRCKRCGYEWTVNADDLDDEVKLFIHFAPDKVYEMLRCPRCGSRDIEIVEGTDVKLKSIRLAEERKG